MGVTLIALLLERILRLLDMLAASNDRFGFVAQLAVNLVPHYLGLTLPAAFFLALMVVVNRMICQRSRKSVSRISSFESK